MSLTNYNELINNYINSTNKLLDIICEQNDYVIFKLFDNKSYLDSIELLIDSYKTKKGLFPKAIILMNEIDKIRLQEETYIKGYRYIEHYVNSYIANNVKIINKEEAINNFLNK